MRRLALLRVLEKGSQQARINALGALGGRDAAVVVPGVVGLLEDASYQVRVAAAETLRAYGWEPDSIRRRVIVSLARSGGELVMPRDLEAFYASAASAGEDAVEPLEVAFTSFDWRVHRAAVEALTRTGSERAPAILQRLASDYPSGYGLEHDTGDVRRAAAIGVAKARDQSLQLPESPAAPDVSRPGSPLVQVLRVDDLAVGDMVRLWHDVLGQWASGWLEVRGVVGDLIVFRDSGTGLYETRARSDIEGWQPPPLWRVPAVVG